MPILTRVKLIVNPTSPQLVEVDNDEHQPLHHQSIATSANLGPAIDHYVMVYSVIVP